MSSLLREGNYICYQLKTLTCEPQIIYHPSHHLYSSLQATDSARYERELDISRIHRATNDEHQILIIHRVNDQKLIKIILI